MATAKTFINWTEEDFTHSYGKEPYAVKAKDRIMLPSYIAEHLAKHLVDRELNKLDKRTNDPLLRIEFMNKCFGESVQASSEEKMKVEVLNAKEEKFEGLA